MEAEDGNPGKTIPHAIHLLISAVIMIIGFITTQIFLEYLCDVHDKFLISGYWLFSVFPALLYIAYLERRGIASLSDIGLTRDNLGKGILYGTAAGLIAGLMEWFFLHLTCPTPESLPWNFTALALFSSVLSAPVREEILTRGIIWSVSDDILNLLGHKFKGIGGRRRDALLITSVSLAFVFMHTGREPQVLFTAILFNSFAYSIVYWRTGNLAAPMTAHAISNLFVILGAILPA